MSYSTVMAEKLVPYYSHVITALACLGLVGHYANATTYTVSANPSTVEINGTVTLSCEIINPTGFTVQWRKKISGTFTDIASATTARGCFFSSAFDNNNYQWDICGKPNTDSPRDYNLKIIKATPTDSATWNCFDIGAGKASDPVQVKVQVPPKTPVMTGLDKPIGVGATHTLTCDAHQQGISDPITYTWYKDDTVKATGNTLTFSPVAKADAGTYQCQARNAVATKASQKLDLEVYYAPDSITLSSTKDTRPFNQQETFTCTISGSKPPNPTLTIYREKAGTQQILNGTGPTLELKDRIMVKEDDNAKFYCESSLVGYPSVSKKSNVISYTVQYPHTVQVITNATSTTVVAGSTFTLTCNATGGNPSAVRQYQWRRNGVVLQSTSRVYYIHDLKYNEGGVYGCTATNEGGSDSDSLNITVQYPPLWNPALPEVFTATATLNMPATFTLHVIANPVATTATWFRYYGPKNYTNLDSNFTPKKVNETTYTLTIASVKQSYFGEYKVDVASPTGPSSFIFKLSTPGKPYPPCCLNITMETSKSVTLTFEAGFYGGSRQTFTIEYREDSETWRDAKTNIGDPGTGMTAAVKITDLKAETRYNFRVYGQNSDGRSTYSNITGTRTDAAPPIDADKISIIRSKTDVTISWPSLGRLYTKIEIEFCVIRGANRGQCTTHLVKDTSRTEEDIVVGEGKEYAYTFRIYDTDDLVYESPALASRTELPIEMIAGGAAGGGALLLIIIIITAVCISKKRKSKKEKNDIELHRVIKSNVPTSPDSEGSKKFHVFAKPHAKNTLKRKYQDALVDKSKKKGSIDFGAFGQINPGYEDEFKRHDQARKDSLASILDKGHFAYEDVSINNYCPKMTSNESAAYAEVELRTPEPGKKDMPDGALDNLDLSAMINKPNHAEYTQVDLTKKTRPNANNLNEPPGVKVNNSDMNKGAVYAEVDLTKKANRPHLTVDDVSVDGADPDQSFEIKIKVKAPKPKTKSNPEPTYENTDIKTNINNLNINHSDEGAYANTGDDAVYSEVGAAQSNKPPTVGVDGTVYADVNLMNHTPSKKGVVKGSEPNAEYAQVDFEKKAPPMSGKMEEI